MKRASEDAVSGVEGFFDAIAVVDIDVNVEDTLVVAEEFYDRENDVVDIAETGSFSLFSVVETTCPVDRNVRFTGSESICSGCRRLGG